MAKGLGTEWESRFSEVDVLRNKGAIYGFTFVLDQKNANKFRKDIKSCLNKAKDDTNVGVEIRAYFGRYTRKGFKLITKVHPLKTDTA